MDFRQFEKEFLRLAFTTDIELSDSSLAFVTSISIAEARRHMSRLLEQGILELDSDDEGHLHYVMPDRPSRPMRLDHPALAGHRDVTTRCILGSDMQPARAMVVRTMRPGALDAAPAPTVGQAMVGMFLNALVCPGVGSMIGGRTGTGLAQLALFGIGVPLALFTVGVPLMIVAWVWAMVTGAQLLTEARD